jgi:hypothetical protein
MMDWMILLNTEYGTAFPLRDDAMLVRDGIYKLTSHQYVYVFDDAAVGVCFRGFAWVAGDRAAGGLFQRDHHAEPEISMPPAELLPDLQPLTFQKVVAHGQTAFADTFSLWTAFTTIVGFGDYSIHFRDAFPTESALPIAIEMDRDPWRHIPLE